ncbi:DUF5655 domain-containing protein [Lactococcus protaetiae]|uniref:DUF5655 domain-containing protein n=1 Tax=Lactococcus protaetiae TaxID=2592653 RepID=A0A514Z677_9LACT|nr:DUF5655 domain-containing protein [Lactococcus protaetiae]QDK70099.1 hypothetical protein FLP15_01545 [Lactococcus protaetiae]
MLYQIEKDKISGRIRKQEFKLEKDLQRFFEKNTSYILPNCDFIASELTVAGFRFDSLLFDNENNAFLIVEYKRKENDGVVDQGYAYLNIAESHKESLVLAYNNIKKSFREPKEFDWSQTRVLFVAPAFNKHQREAMNNKKLPFDLMTVNRYEGNIIDIDYVNKTYESAIKFPSVSRQITVKTEEDFMKKVDDSVKELYFRLRDEITSWDMDIKVAPTKVYIAFKLISNFMDVEFTTRNMRVTLNLKKGTLKDGNRVARDMSETGHRGNGDYEIRLDESTDYNYFLSLVKQAYDFQKNNN